jgi:hypothetical protein
MHKFGWLPDEKDEELYEYANIWAREKTSGPDRLVIAPRAHYTQLLQTLTECIHEPFQLLYVLVVPHGGEPVGRYQSEYSFIRTQLQEFLTSYSNFFEQDARHNLWIRSESGGGLLVYDRHNVIYAYGPLDRFIPALTSSGLAESEEVRFPSPHTHHYHAEFDIQEKRLLQSEQWIISPLRTSDENPE